MADYLARLWSAVRGKPYGADAVLDAPSRFLGRWEDEAGRYDVLDAYRASEDLYGRLKNELKLGGYEGYQNVRNPANRLVEFYAAKLPDRLLEHLKTGAEGAETEDAGEGPEGTALDPETLKALIKQIHEWSNWEDRSEVAARNFATHGDLFVKVENSEDNRRVQLNLLDPRHVAEDFRTDARGFFTYLRLDIPQEERDENEPDAVKEYTRTEVWDKKAGQYLVYEHDERPGAKLEELGNPVYFALLTAERPDNPSARWTGYDFVPVVHRKLKDTGEARGEGAFQHALGRIDTANWLATRLNKMLFPRVTWKGTRLNGPGGSSLGPFTIDSEDPADEALSRLTAAEQEGYAVVEVEGDRIVRLPSGTDLTPMVPPIDFVSHLAALDAELKDLGKELPEDAYYRLREMSEISGRAARILLGDVLDRFDKARKKFEDAHVRAHKMAITIARVVGVEGFEGVPEDAYEAGLLDHSFKQYELFPVSELEISEGDKAEAESLQEWKELGPEVYRKKLEGAGLGLTEAELASASQARPTQSPLSAVFGRNAPSGNAGQP